MEIDASGESRTAYGDSLAQMARQGATKRTAPLRAYATSEALAPSPDTVVVLQGMLVGVTLRQYSNSYAIARRAP